MADNTTAKTFQFELVSPERLLASEQISMVTIPGEDGDFGVLAGHAPMLSSIRPGVVVITDAQQNQRKVFVSGGFADVGESVCSVLAEEAINVADLDRSALEQSLKMLTEDLNLSKDDLLKAPQLQTALDLTKAKLSAIAA